MSPILTALARRLWERTIQTHMANIRTACSGCIHVRDGDRLSKYMDVIANKDKGGGMPRSTNRTLWPVTGGAVGVQPGWFNGHKNAFMYINLGHGTLPENFSMIMQPVFEIVGPTNFLYPGSICLPQVPLPTNYTAVVGQNATIQVIELAQHGASLYNVSHSVSHFLS